MRATRIGLTLLGVAALVASGCGDDDESADADATTTTAAPDDAEPSTDDESTTTEATEPAEPALEGTITVYAAASLTDAFTEVGAEFEDANEGVTVEFNFAGSSTLRDQILDGAPADVFASANLSNMDAIVEGGAAEGGAVEGAPQVFVTNSLQIAVPLDNPGGVTGLDDFARDELLIGLCAEEVPCGQFGREALTAAGVTPALDTNEPDVRSLLGKVAEGELELGIVYVTDVLSEPDVLGIEIPADQNVIADYPIAPLIDAGNAEVAAAFVDFVLSSEGQDLLVGYGFDAP